MNGFNTLEIYVYNYDIIIAGGCQCNVVVGQYKSVPDTDRYKYCVKMGFQPSELAKIFMSRFVF